MNKTITALITPFKNGKLNEEGLCTNIHFQLKEGINEFLVLGSTGEMESLNMHERSHVIQIAKTETRNKAFLWVQTGGSSTHHTIKNTQEAEKLGADGIVVVTPYYCLPTQEGLLHHFEAVSQSTKLPIILYHHPKRTGTSFTIDTLRRLSQMHNIMGLKDASGNMRFVSEVLHALPDLALFSGDDLLTLPLMSIGAQGVVSVISNIVPRKIRSLVEHRAPSLYRELFPLFQLSQCETNPIPIKAMMNLMGMPAGECRLPLTPLSKKHQQEIEEQFLSNV